MKVLNGWDAVSGKEGRAYAKIDGNNEELFYACLLYTSDAADE